MIIQRVSPGARRMLGRGVVLLPAALLFLLSGASAGHAEEGALPLDAPILVETAIEPVVETAETTVQQPLEPAVEPVVQTAQPALPEPLEEAAEPVVRVVEAAVHEAVEPVVQVVEPVVESTPVPEAPTAPIGGDPHDGRTGDEPNVDGAVNHTPVATSRVGEPRHAASADRRHRQDLTPRAGGRWSPRHVGAGDSHGNDHSADQPSTNVVAITNALMHAWAGLEVPAGINAGLPGVVASIRTPWTVLVLVLGSVLLMAARRRLR